MPWKDLIQAAFYFVGIVVSVATLISVVQAIRQYRRNTRQRVAQSLIDLEDRLEAFWEIMPLIDPASGRYDLELRRAVQNSLDEVPPEQREPADKTLIPQLDRFLRFLLLLSSLEKYQLLKREALDYMYWYWFDAVYVRNAHLRQYIAKYFPTLNKFLVDKFGSR